MEKEALASEVWTKLEDQLEGDLRRDDYSRMLYSTDASIYRITPLAVVLPKSKEDVQTTIQVAREHGIAVLPRGGGTSLSGQAVGEAVVFDFSRYMNQILSINPQKRLVRVQPGVVLDQLNAFLAPYGLQFGPDVATSNRANIGGMIGNNSAGARSVVYGKTIDHIQSLDVLLSDGTEQRLAPMSLEQWQDLVITDSLPGHAARAIDTAVRSHADEIRRRFPRILRRVSGYNLDEFLDPLTGSSDMTLPALQPRWGRKLHLDEPLNLSKIIAGSEGTLATVVEANLHVVSAPRQTGLVLVHFDSLAAALEVLGLILECGPSAVELVDRMILDLAAQNLQTAREMSYISGSPDALLIVEFSAETPDDLAAQAALLEKRLQGITGVGKLVRALDRETRDAVWRMRKHGMGILQGIPGAKKPISFVEDTAVAPERLPEFVHRFQTILSDHHTGGSFYGHASVGCLHIRPLINLKDPAQVDDMVSISERVAELVGEFDGAMSGEHGDGLARSMFNRRLFGETIYEAFREIKRSFDPAGIMNPGKIVDAPHMRENLRFPTGYSFELPETVFDYTREGGIDAAVEVCNGSGACRKIGTGTMCPSFVATREEEHSTRGRANALRNALSNQSSLDGLSDRRVYDTLDLCLMCKGCKAECPANVDIAKLKAEFLQAYQDRWGLPLGARLIGQVHRFQRIGSRFPRLANFAGRSGLVRMLLEKFAGIDRRRSLPQFAHESFHRWFEKRPQRATGAKVLLLDDCFTNYNEPEVAKAAVLVMEAAGYAVELAGLPCCGRTMISKGLLRAARELAHDNVKQLLGRVTDETPLVGCEPSCILSFRDEYRDFSIPDATTVLENSLSFEEWCSNNLGGELFEPTPSKLVVHGHCHQKALIGAKGTLEALRLVHGTDVQLLDTGCCGMAGSFGYELGHYEISKAIAESGLLPKLSEQPDSRVIAPGFSCRSQIKELAGHTADHPAVFLAERLR